MPSIKQDLEKAMRVAVAAVDSKETFNAAYTLIQNPEIDINSTGEKTGKTALSFAVEKLFSPLIKNPESMSKEAVIWKLKIIDELLANGARIAAVMQRDSPAEILMNVASAKANVIMRRVVLRAKDNPSAKDIFGDLSEEEKLFIAAFHYSSEMIKMATKVEGLEEAHLRNIKDNKYEKIESKPILIFENHSDDGTYEFLNRTKKRLIREGYTSVCLELPNTTTIDFLRIIKDQRKLYDLLLQSEFVPTLTFIDPRTDYSRNLAYMGLDEFSISYLAPSLSASIRDKGMYLMICARALQHNGKVIAICGMAHSNAIINNLNMLGIQNIPIVPFTEPEKVKLRTSDTGEFSSVLDPDHNITLLFARYKAKQMFLPSNDKEKVAETLEKFAALDLRRS